MSISAPVRVAFCCMLVQAYLQLCFNRLVDNPLRAPAHRADAKALLMIAHECVLYPDTLGLVRGGLF